VAQVIGRKIDGEIIAGQIPLELARPRLVLKVEREIEQACELGPCHERPVVETDCVRATMISVAHRLGVTCIFAA